MKNNASEGQAKRKHRSVGPQDKANTKNKEVMNKQMEESDLSDFGSENEQFDDQLEAVGQFPHRGAASRARARNRTRRARFYHQQRYCAGNWTINHGEIPIQRRYERRKRRQQLRLTSTSFFGLLNEKRRIRRRIWRLKRRLRQLNWKIDNVRGYTRESHSRNPRGRRPVEKNRARMRYC